MKVDPTLSPTEAINPRAGGVAPIQAELGSDGFWSGTWREEQGMALPMAATSNAAVREKTLK